MPQPLNINYQQLTDLISDAETEQVFGVLQKALRGQSDYGEYFKEVVLLSNSYSDLQKARRIDIVGFQDYTTKSNQITNALLELLDDLKEGKAYRVHQPANISLMSFWKIAAILAFLLLSVFGGIGTAAYFYFKDKEGNDKKVVWSCPVYNTPAFKVLVLPFHKNLPEGRIPPHRHIISRLDKFAKEKKLQVHVGAIQPDGSIPAAYSPQEANVYADKCQPDMLVWGTADMQGEKTGLVMHYSITNPIQFEWLSDFEREGKIDTVLTEALTSKPFEGATQQIEEILEKIIEMMVALKNEEFATVTSLSEALIKSTPSVRAEGDADMFLQYAKAFSHQKNKEPEKAIAAYSEILAQDPTETKALNNRAHLYVRQKQYPEALADFNTLETLGKADYEVLYKKAEIHEKLGNLGSAKKGYEKAEAVCPSKRKPTIQANIRQVDEKIKIKIEKDKISKGNRTKPTRASNNTSAPITPSRPQLSKAAKVKELLSEAISSNIIGDATIAEEKAIEVLKKQPQNKEALREFIKSKYQQDNTISLPDLRKNPYLRNVDSTTLKKLNDPILEAVLRNGIIKKE